MKDTVPRLNLAPKLNGPLRLWDPRDYLRLLYWIFFFPQALRWYEETFIAPEHRGAKGKALLQAIDQDSVLRHLIFQALIISLFMSLLCMVVLDALLSTQIEWIGLAFIALIIAVFGVTIGAAFCMAFGVTLGAVICVAFVAAFPLVGFLAGVLIAFESQAVMEIPGFDIRTYLGDDMLSFVFDSLIFGSAVGVALGIALGLAEGTAKSIADVVDSGTSGIMAEGAAFVVGLSVTGALRLDMVGLVDLKNNEIASGVIVLGAAATLALGLVGLIPLGAAAGIVASGVAVVVAGGMIGGVIIVVFQDAIHGIAFCSAFCAIGVMILGMVASLAILRPDAWAVAALMSFFPHSRYALMCTILPLPNLRHRLKDWLRCDWSTGVHNINELLAYSMQLIPVVQALNESLAEHPPERLLPRVDEVSRNPYDWNLLRYASASLANRLKSNAIEGFPLPGRWKRPLKKRYSTELRLDTPARAACAGYWYLHENQSLLAAQAFSVVRSLPNGEEMHFLSQALFLAQSVDNLQDLSDLARRKAFLQATTRPSELNVLHPETWKALEHLQRCALEAHAVKESVSKAVKSWALNRAIGEAMSVQKMIGSLPQAERALVEEIAKNWQNLLVSESSNIGDISIQEPVKNPYVAGDPVVGPGFKGREDILRSLEELWCGATAPPSVVLCGHRRMGKTSILRNINSHLGAEVRLAYVNLLTLGGASGGVSDLFLAMADEIRDALPALPEPETSEFYSHPYRALEQYLGQAKAVLGSSRLIIALDEFEQLEEWMRAGRIPRDLLNVLRGYMQKDEHIAFAFAGLHTLEEMTADYFNPLFASMRTIPVSFLSHDATFQILANPPLEDFPLDYSREALERIWQLTGGQPYLVQLVGHYLVSRFNRLTFEQGKSLQPVFSLEDVEAVIDGPEFYSQGRYYFAGVWGQAGQGAEGQQKMLKLVAAFPGGISFEGIVARFGQDTDRLTAALKELERHDVLLEKDGEWQFTVELMRRWVKEFM
jgi:hypothetical protein